MQYLAHYGKTGGIYLGAHDPKASTKRFHVETVHGMLQITPEFIIPDKTRSANDWAMPGVIELDVFTGDWYDAAMIYREWASRSAEYWPQMGDARLKRQQQLGQIGVWQYYAAAPDHPIERIEQEMQDYIDYFAGVPVGIHWYRWNGKAHDEDYPHYFPERSGMISLVNRLQASGKAFIMPYINGRLYDTNLPDYAINGYPYATTNSLGEIHSQDFNGNHFAVMCPTQKPWQTNISNTASQLTRRIGSAGVYIDQVAAAGPIECMHPDHEHPLGGGHWWREGYNQMFAQIHTEIPEGKFIVVEGGNDFIANQVDGFLTDGWNTNNLVPAFQAIYSGRVQLIGKRTGTGEYTKPAYYAKLAQAFVQGIQPGRTSSWIIADPNARDQAAPFVRQLATLRFKLRDFLSFGRLKKPLRLDGNIPDITSTWYDFGKPVEVTVSAIQTGTFQNKEKNAVALVFINASITDNIAFDFDFNGELYGLSGELTLQELSENSLATPLPVNNSFRHSTTLPPLAVSAFIIE